MTKKKRTIRKHDIVFTDKHLTPQDHGGSGDINYIAQQYMSGRLPYPQVPPPTFADISTVDLAHSRNVLATISSEFERLPSDVRDHFKNKSDNYLGFIHENAEDIAENGLRDVLWDAVNPEPDPVEAASAQNAQNTEGEATTEPEGKHSSST